MSERNENNNEEVNEVALWLSYIAMAVFAVVAIWYFFSVVDVINNPRSNHPSIYDKDW